MIILKSMKGHALLSMQGYGLLALASFEVRKEAPFTKRTPRARKLGDRAAGDTSCNRIIEMSQHIFKS